MTSLERFNLRNEFLSIQMKDKLTDREHFRLYEIAEALRLADLKEQDPMERRDEVEL